MTHFLKKSASAFQHQTYVVRIKPFEKLIILWGVSNAKFWTIFDDFKAFSVTTFSTLLTIQRLKFDYSSIRKSMLVTPQ